MDNIHKLAKLQEKRQAERLRKLSAGREAEPDAEPEIELSTIPFPDPPDPKVFYGLPGEFVRIVEPHYEGDPVALLISFLTEFGCTVGRKPYFKVGATRHYAVVFTISLGRTSRSRKGSGERWVDYVFELIFELIPDYRVRRKGGLSSGEGLIYEVRDRVVKERKKDNGEVEEEVIDEGVEDKRLIIYEPEFAFPLKAMEREGNTLSAVLRQVWDCQEVISPMTKRSRISATGAHIVIIGHTTKEEFLRHVPEIMLVNGLLNRFLLFAVRRTKSLPKGVGEGGFPKKELDDLAEEVKRRIETVSQERAMERDAEAEQLWEEKYPELTADKPGLFGAVVARAEAHVLRLSMLYALTDGSFVIKKDHLEAALALWRYCEDSARFIFGDKLGDPRLDRIFQEVKKAGAAGFEWSKLFRVFKNHIEAAVLKELVGKLISYGLVGLRREETDGRPKTFIYYIGCEKSEKSEKADGCRIPSEDPLRKKGEESGEQQLPDPFFANTENTQTLEPSLFSHNSLFSQYRKKNMVVTPGETDTAFDEIYQEWKERERR